jgi:deazaflavin-dependent oxidoreductase (nitroreductase family)
MKPIRRTGALRSFLRAPIYLYWLRLGRLLGTCFLLLTHVGRRTGLRRQTVSEVMEYRQDGPEAVVTRGFGANSDWLLNIQATPSEEVGVGSHHFIASHRFLGEEEAMSVVCNYELCNRAADQFLSGKVRVASGILC